MIKVKLIYPESIAEEMAELPKDRRQKIENFLLVNWINIGKEHIKITWTQKITLMYFFRVMYNLGINVIAKQEVQLLIDEEANKFNEALIQKYNSDLNLLLSSNDRIYLRKNYKNYTVRSTNFRSEIIFKIAPHFILTKDRISIDKKRLYKMLELTKDGQILAKIYGLSAIPILHRDNLITYTDRVMLREGIIYINIGEK